MSAGARLAGRVELAPVPPPLVAALRAVAAVVRRSPVGGQLASGTPLGHPAHPALVSGPLGAWTSALLLDLTGGSPAAARRLVGAGVLMAAPTAVTGLDDWLDTTGAEQRVGAVHATANLVATGGFALSWALRRRHHGAGVAIGLAAAAVAGAAGWLGGHLTYGLGVGVDTNAFETGPSEWTSLPVSLPADEMAAAELDGVVLAGTCLSEGPVVLSGRCSHRGGPLGEGQVEGGCVTCPWHGSRFDLRSGQVRQGPASVPQPVYETRLLGTDLQVRRQEARSLRANPV